MKLGYCALGACGVLVAACSGSGGGIGGGGGGGDGHDGGSSASGFATGSSSGGSSQNTGSTGSSSGGQGSGSAGVSLVVDSVSSPGSIGGLGPSSGSFYLVVDMTLKNTGASRALPVSGVFFSLQTAQNLVISVSPAQPTNACSSSVSVASGGENECQIAFEVPSGQTAATLKYDDHLGDSASAAIPEVATPSPACQTWNGWLVSSSTSSACRSCLLSAESGDAGPCASAREAYGGSCVADGGGINQCLTSGSIDQVCSCELTADSASCHGLFDTMVACIVSSCMSTCP